MKKIIYLLLSLLLISLCSCSSSGIKTIEEDVTLTTTVDTLVTDNENVKVVLDSIEEEGRYYNLNFTITNKTDTDLVAVMENSTINRVVYEPEFNYHIEAGQTTQVSARYVTLNFENSGIDEVLLIDSHLRLWTATDNVVTAYDGHLFLYPLGDDSITIGLREDLETDKIVYEDEYVKIVAMNKTTEEGGSYFKVRYYFLNKTDKNLHMTFKDSTLNTQEYNTNVYAKIAPEAMFYCTELILLNDLEAMGVSVNDISEITYKINMTVDSKLIFEDKDLVVDVASLITK